MAANTEFEVHMNECVDEEAQGAATALPVWDGADYRRRLREWDEYPDAPEPEEGD